MRQRVLAAAAAGAAVLALTACGDGGEGAVVVEESTAAAEADSAAPGDPGTTGDFLSAGGHPGSGSGGHPGHAGDLTGLHVTEAGLGFLTTVTDRFAVEDLVADDDGSAVVLHAGPDNFGNVPGRYAPEGPDGTTRATGDAGSRPACGVVE